MKVSSEVLDASALGRAPSRFSFKRKISFKNATSLKLILDKAEYLRKVPDKDDVDAIV